MDATHVGAFTLLLCEQWEKGAVVDDLPELAVLCKCPEQVVARTLALAFALTEAGWQNARLEEIRAEQVAKSGLASKAAQVRWSDADALRTQCLREEEREVERDTATTSLLVARRVADFCLMTSANWKLKTGIPEWSEHLVLEAKYVGVDLPYQINRCTEWHVGKHKAPRAPDQAIRNWLERAAGDLRHKGTNGNGKSGGAKPTGASEMDSRARGRQTHPVAE